MKLVSILFLFLFVWCMTPVVEPHSMMTHASMDIGNIISIIIPENSPTNMNIDQLTLDLRRQLERIKQNQILKSDYKSVILKNKFLDVSNNKNQESKSVGLFGKTYQGKINYYYYYYLPQILRIKTNPSNLKKKFRGYQHPSSSRQNKKNFRHHNKIKMNADKKLKTRKVKKNSITAVTRRNYYQTRKFDSSLNDDDDNDDDVNQDKYSTREKIFSKDWNQERIIDNYNNKINQIDDSSINYKNNDQQNVESIEPRVESSCLMINNKGNKPKSIKEVFTNEFEKNNAINNDCVEEIDADGQVISSCSNESSTNSLETIKSNNKEEINFENKEKYDDTINNININETINNNGYDAAKQKNFLIDFKTESFKEIARLLQNLEDLANNTNLSNTENEIEMDVDENLLNTNVEVNDNLQNGVLLTSMSQNGHSNIVDNDSKVDDTNSLYEYVDKNRNLIDDKEPTPITDRVTYQSGMQNILNRDDRNVKIDHDNSERIKRSIDDHGSSKKLTKHHVMKPDVRKRESKAKDKIKWVPMKTTMKSKNSWKLYPNIPTKSTTI